MRLVRGLVRSCLGLVAPVATPTDDGRFDAVGLADAGDCRSSRRRKAFGDAELLTLFSGVRSSFIPEISPLDTLPDATHSSGLSMGRKRRPCVRGGGFDVGTMRNAVGGVVVSEMSTL